MRNLLASPVSRFRLAGKQIEDRYGSIGNHEAGVFLIPSGTRLGDYRTSAAVFCIAASGLGWDHVSASCKARTPNWAEMSLVHRLFFEDDEAAMQLHLPPSDHIDNNPFALHVWRPLKGEIPLPPKEFV